jgi:hypothetical protein
MKTFLNVVGILALIGSMLVFANAQSAVHEIEACIALLLSCSCLGFAAVVERLDQSKNLLAMIAKSSAEGVQTQASSSGSVSRAIPPVPGKETYYISDGARPLGPYEAEKIQALFDKGTINKETDILKEGSSEWEKLGDIFEV